MDGLTLRHSGEAKHTTHQTPLERSKFLIRRETRCQLQSGDCYAGSVLAMFLKIFFSITNRLFHQWFISCISFRSMERGLKNYLQIAERSNKAREIGDFGRLIKMAVLPLPPLSAFLPTYVRTVQPYANIPSFFILSCVRSRSSTNVSFSARLLKIATPITAGLLCGSGG